MTMKTITGSNPPDEAKPLEFARRYLAMGWFLVPLNTVRRDGTCRCVKGPRCASAGKHPLGWLVRHGAKDASSYPPTVERWFNIHPTMNIGVVTGPSALASLDVDPRNGGDESFAQLERAHGPLPSTLLLLTGGGGRQYLFADPHGSVRKHSPLSGIDILGGRSLFVAPPSMHRSGTRYRWANWGTALAPVPAWIMEDGS